MELHIVPVDEAEHRDRFILFRPLLGLAFIGNEAMVWKLSTSCGEQGVVSCIPGHGWDW